MTILVTKMERFLSGAIQNAGAEILEELESLEEGSDLKQSILTLRSIVRDLIDSSAQLHKYDLDSDEESSETLEEDSSPPDSSKYDFEVGELAVIGPNRIVYRGYGDPNFEMLFRDYMDSASLPKTHHFDPETVVKVFAKAFDPYSENGGYCYIVKANGLTALVGEVALEKYTPSEFKFEICERVRVERTSSYRSVRLEGVIKNRERFPSGRIGYYVSFEPVGSDFLYENEIQKIDE